MSANLSEMIAKASTQFTSDIVKAIEDAEFQMDDIDQLTREDVNEEFRGFRFGIRKELWLFFKAFKRSPPKLQDARTTKTILNENIQEERDPCIIKKVTSVSSPNMFSNYFRKNAQGLVPISSDDEAESSNSSIFGPSSPIHNKIVPKSPKSPNAFFIPYPGNITSPFPLSQILKESLVGNNSIKRNDSVFNSLVAEVHNTLKNSLGPNISEGDLRYTAAMLCVEYPGLRSEGEDGWTMLYSALKDWNSLHVTSQSPIDLHDNSNPDDEVSDCPETSSTMTFQNQKKSYLASKNASPLPYPNGITWPFPLNVSLREYMSKGYDILNNTNRKAFQELVRDISTILKNVLGRNPDQYEVKCTVTNLCLEYPVLCQNGLRYSPTLHRAIRKKFNNMDYKKRSQTQIYPPHDAHIVKIEEGLPSKRQCTEDE
uniref:uncharacterized protein LOC120329417 n=1 Tax=Styela clava TaxID=7725 RepID=UPI00193A4BA0|nr:uncharacterized protein LOC120329417 [Styela clava]